jgi:hypothetical protein
MNEKILFIMIILFAILTCGCMSQIQSNQTNQNSINSNTSSSQNATPVNPPPILTSENITLKNSSISEIPTVSSSGKSQYLAAVDRYLENISVNINSIKSAKIYSNYAMLKESGDKLGLNLVLDKQFSYKGDDPKLINIELEFPYYIDNLQHAASHYYQAGDKGLINESSAATTEIKAGDAYYDVAIITGRKIIIELHNQNISISKNIEDAHEMWFENPQVYT